MSSRVEVQESKRLFGAMLGLIFFSFLLGALLLPWVFNGLMYLGRTVEGLSGLRNIAFEKVFPRIVMLVAALGFYPALRYGGVSSREELGFRRDVPRLRSVGTGWAVGAVSVLFLFLVGLLLGVYVWSVDSMAKILGRLGGYLPGSLLVGLIEETFFRGALLLALRRAFGLFWAVVVVSAFFSFVHFIGPIPPEGVVYGHAFSGFALFPHLIHRTADVAFYFPFSLTLFLMSVVLCLFAVRQGHVYFIIGLHAGWVLFLQMGRFFVEPNPDCALWFFGVSDSISKAWIATFMMGLFGLVAWRKRVSG